ncbi:hypothetical protein ES319_D06G038300v1 [Gossypium barbadense]|uniref:Plant heme peroxidase family profile domain-containing protein n=2 Tax=Gossypium TaxID=3633 RepID=A0A5J5QXN0_GOSBA|nr:hypothetical protein ES319_D06G038300v1 [Gossypium barbadense]PPD85057.1 hypothetical protein GOBAR_DD18010 [Gossypium barbadense]TYG63577.1 hypothetical protein ES288_D06G041000v1 [Gossypium darwinii]
MEAMRVSFLSTTPSLVSLVPVSDPSLNSPSIAATRYLTRPVAIRCSNNNTQSVDVCGEYGFHRRDVLKCIGASVGMELLASSGSWVEMASAADLIQRRQRSEFLSSIKETLAKAMTGNPDLIPSMLTLALNDAMTYDKATKSGGSNGSIRFSSELSRPENKGLAAAMSLLDEAKKEIDSYSKGGPISYADLIQYAAQAAVKSTFLAAAIRKCGGNEDKGRTLYAAYGSSGQWGLFDRQFGRSDAEEPDPEGRVPIWEKASVQEMKDKFKEIGFGPRQLAVMSAFLGPEQSATEALLVNDPEVTPWVQKYQRSRETVSQTDYEVDLITTLTKLSCLGQQINYEAYTYPVKKIELSKLKL